MLKDFVDLSACCRVADDGSGPPLYLISVDFSWTFITGTCFFVSLAAWLLLMMIVFKWSYSENYWLTRTYGVVDDLNAQCVLNGCVCSEWPAVVVHDGDLVAHSVRTAVGGVSGRC